MRRLSSYVGQFRSEVKALVADHLTLAHVRASLGHALEVVFPAQGIDRTAPQPGDLAAAGDPVSGQGLAPQAWAKIRFLDREGCEMCARPFEGGLHLGADARCTWCTEKPFPFRITRAACLYDDTSKDIILGFKHGDRLDLAPMLSRWLERAGADVLAGADVVVPVPLHWRRLLHRRYNQAAELARPLARRTNRLYLADGLKRIKMTAHQGKSAADRWANVRDAFAVTPAGRKKLAGKAVVLIDDVFTTGSTLKACAQELLKAGARSVDIVVLARAAKSDPL